MSKAILAAGLIMLLMGGCSTVSILQTQAVPEFSLEKYKSFDFYELAIDGESLDEYGERIQWMKEQITLQMGERGLERSKQDPDLLVNIGMVFAEEDQTTETSLVLDAPRYSGSMNYSWQSEDMKVGTYREGTVVVHFVDRESQILVWEGIAQAVVVKSDQSSQKNIALGVKKLFKDL